MESVVVHEVAATRGIEEELEEIFTRALRRQPQIQHIVLAGDNGLVVAYKSRTKGKEQRLAALAPVVGDAGESMFNGLGLAPLGEVILNGAEGSAYLVRLKSQPVFLLIAAQGQVNIGLLRMLAGEIEAESNEALTKLLR